MREQDWFAYLEKKLPLEPEAWQALLGLKPGHALVFASIHRLFVSDAKVGGGAAEAHPNIVTMKIRPRLTANRGSSVVNRR